MCFTFCDGHFTNYVGVDWGPWFRVVIWHENFAVVDWHFFDRPGKRMHLGSCPYDLRSHEEVALDAGMESATVAANLAEWSHETLAFEVLPQAIERFIEESNGALAQARSDSSGELGAEMTSVALGAFSLVGLPRSELN
jgi:hypothetical protein